MNPTDKAGRQIQIIIRKVRRHLFVFVTNRDLEATNYGSERALRPSAVYRKITNGFRSEWGAKLYADGYTGRARMVVDADRGTVLGVTLVGPGATELLHAATIAVAGQVPIDRLWHAVPCFPTISELWLRLLEAYRDSSA